MAKKKKSIRKIPVLHADDMARLYNYRMALELQRSIINSGFYVGSDYKLYKVNPPQQYTQGAPEAIKGIYNG